MDIEIVEEQGMDLELVLAIPADMRQYEIAGTNQILVKGDAFRFLLQEFKGRGFSAWYSRFWSEELIILRARGDIAFLELRIGIHNELVGTWEKIPSPQLRPYEFNLSFTPYIDTRAIFKASRHWATFDIHFDVDFLAKLGFDYSELMKFLEVVEKGDAAELVPFPHICPYSMQQAIQFVLKDPICQKQPKLLEVKITEILLIALEKVSSPEKPLPIKLSPREIEGLHTIKACILDSFPKWPESAALCRKGEINEFKLKVGFKHLFKMTAYEYHMLLKFQHAKKLLLHTSEAISSIAYEIGYDHVPSFNKEFKKQFGCKPGYFKKHGKM